MKKRVLGLTLCMGLAGGVAPAEAQQGESYDLLIRGVRLIDGTGTPWVRV